MVGRVKYMKDKWYPRPHDLKYTYSHKIQSSTQEATIVPLMMYDEGMTSPSNYKSNPVNPSFSETDDCNIYPESYMDGFFCKVTFNLSFNALHNDNLDIVNVGFMPIFTAFKEDLTPKDEVSTLDIEDILELQHEDTDRQCYPLYTGTDMTARFTGGTDLGANMPGLTTDEKLEAVDFDLETYRDALNYYTNAGKLKEVQGGYKVVTLTRKNPVKSYRIRLRSDNKRANEYMFSGLLTHMPQAGTHNQPSVNAESTANSTTVVTQIKCRYYEWNDSFNTERA